MNEDYYEAQVREHRAKIRLQEAIRSAPYEENGFFLVPTENSGGYLPTYAHSNVTYQAVCLHECPANGGIFDFTPKLHATRPPMLGTYPRDDLKVIQMCQVCGIEIPEAVKTLWTLWNADCLSEER
jgi:hypothetical protein